MPTVSICIPSYNHEKYIAETIQSILDQTFQDFEIIITDDGSIDSTVAEIKKFNDPRIKLFEFEENKGSPIAYGNCVKHATGKYIANLSSDDMFLPDKLEKQVAFLDSHTNYGAVFTLVNLIDEEGNDFKDTTHYYYDIFEQENRNRFEWLEKFFHDNNCLCHPSVLARKEIYAPFVLDELPFPQTGDFNYWVRMCLQTEIYIIQEKLVKFRIRNDQANASAHTLAVQITARYEIMRILNNYLGLDREAFVRVFPQYGRYEDVLDKNTIKFFFAQEALKKDSFPHYQIFGINALYDLFSDQDARNKLQNALSYPLKDFIDCIGHIDAFRLFASQVSYLFIDTGEGFNSKQRISQLIDLSADNFIVEFDVSNFETIGSVRWDPIEKDFCRIIIDQVICTDNHGAQKNIDISAITTNGKKINEHTIEFETLDPQIIVPIDETIIQSIQIKGRLTRLDTYKKFNQIFKEKDRTIKEKDRTIKEKDRTIKEKDRTIKEKDRTITQKDNSIKTKEQRIDELVNSWSFKIGWWTTSPLRYAKDHFHKPGAINPNKDKVPQGDTAIQQIEHDSKSSPGPDEKPTQEPAAISKYTDGTNANHTYRVNIHKPISAKRKKVMHVIANFLTGGSSRLVVDLIEHLGHKYHQEVITIGHNIPEPLAYSGLTYYQCPLNIDAVSIAEFLKGENVDMVHIHYWDHKWYEAFFQAADLYECKVIHNINTPVAPIIHQCVDKYVFVSHYALHYAEPDLEKSIVIYPGSNFELFHRGDAEIPDDTIGMVYRLDQDKLTEDSIQVFIEVVKKRPKTKCIIVGGGLFLNSYKNQVEKEGLKNHFLFTGYVSYDQLPNYYKRLSIFVAPVWKESFGQVSPFAMNMKIPVAGYNIGALSEILGTDECLAHDTERLTKIIIDLLDDREKRITIGMKNYNRAQKHFSIQPMIKKYEMLYDNIF